MILLLTRSTRLLPDVPGAPSTFITTATPRPCLPASLATPPKTSTFSLQPRHRNFSHHAANQAANMTRLTAENINQHVVAAKYAVRGELAVKSEEYRAKIAAGDAADLPFNQVISANIGNPQQLDQKPITFFRQVASLLENPQLLEKEDALVNALGYKTDVIERAKFLLSKIGSVGAYSASTGVPAIRDSVAQFLERELFPASFNLHSPSMAYIAHVALFSRLHWFTAANR